MHLDPDTARRAREGGLDLEEQIRVDAHVDACSACAELLADLELAELLAEVDRPPPPSDPERLIGTARSRSAHGMGRWAAALVLTAVAAGAAYAAPGSPFPRWLGRDGDPEPSERVVTDAIGSDWRGVAVPATDGLSIELPAQEGGTLTLTITDGTEVSVQASDASADFDAGLRRIVVRAATSADYLVSVPSGAADVSVRVDGVVVFRSRAGEVATRARITAPRRYVLSLSDVGR